MSLMLSPELSFLKKKVCLKVTMKWKLRQICSSVLCHASNGLSKRKQMLDWDLSSVDINVRLGLEFS